MHLNKHVAYRTYSYRNTVTNTSEPAPCSILCGTGIIRYAASVTSSENASEAAYTSYARTLLNDFLRVRQSTVAIYHPIVRVKHCTMPSGSPRFSEVISDKLHEQKLLAE
jgi:hypothetical protein